MTDFASSLTRSIARQYDLFQASLEFLQKDRKFLNYGYTVSGKETYEERQERLPRGIPGGRDWSRGRRHRRRLRQRRAGLPPVEHVRVQPPGWLQHLRTAGSLRQRAGHTGERGSQAFVSPGRSRAASRRRRLIRGQDPGDRVRVLLRSPRFYRRAAQVLKPAWWFWPISPSPIVPRSWREGPRTCDESARNRQSEWERHFRTRSVCHINNRTRPGAQMTVWQILKTAPFSRVSTAERRAWMKMAFYSQLVALGLQVSFIQYDLIVLQKK